MKFYPAYKLRDVLEEYAIVFVSLLNEGYRLQNEEYFMQANIQSIPRMEADDAKKFIRELEWASKDVSDILKPSDDYSGLADIKRIMG